jgi:pantetheine-phosphate adenylyltransferase
MAGMQRPQTCREAARRLITRAAFHEIAAMARTAFFPGTFDPPTNGHLDIIRGALALADTVIVAIGVNAAKTPLFSIAERKALIAAAAKTIGRKEAARVTITTFDGLTVDAARAAGAEIIVRGVRDSRDVDYEMQMAAMNGTLAPQIATVFVPASPATRHITATLVRQIAALGGDVAPFVPEAVAKALAKKAR